jgi:two-component system, chemotaxis family, CheB/CheR fusion protein
MNAKRNSQPRRSKSAADRSSIPPIDQPELFPIVGIGASAGGLEAFSQVLSHLPIDTGMAFVLVQHLDPSHKSLLTEILARTTPMPVWEVMDGMAVEPNHVYVIPPNTIMVIGDGILHLSPRAQSRKISMSIDSFFCSLAIDRGDKSIGVILSGGDTDGSQGLAAIKAAGGITLAQSEESAQVSSMPNMAIATGHVDFILPPAAIAEKLASISRHPYIVSSPIAALPSVDATDEQEAIATIFRLLRVATRVDFTHYKHTTIKRRIFRRMALYRLEQLPDYIRYLQENSTELQALYQEILINVTSFFRDATAFTILQQKIFPALVRDRPLDAPLRVWVAGCSTGEEAYSLAICLLEFLANQPHKPQIQIFATDISELMIDRARLGIYQPHQLRDVSPERLQSFFTAVEGGYQINKSVRELCIFARQNLISDPPFSQMDLISCRNVFIYFGTSLQKRVLSMFHYGLMPKGFLLLGTSETVGESPDLFTVIDQKAKIYAKQLSAIRLNLDLLASNYPVEINHPQPIMVEASQNEVAIHQAADQIVLQQYAPVGVVINSQLEIIQFRGQTGAYLEPSPGRASLNLLSMVKEELRLDLRTLIHQVQQDGQALRKESIFMREVSTSNDLSVAPRRIFINVIPFKPNAIQEDYLLVLFGDMLATSIDEVIPPINRRKSSKGHQLSSEQQEIQRLQQELTNTKVYLQSIIEKQQSSNQDLRVANEEILSSNEELQSTNEELQTAKEEIQATNEELSTINNELYRRNAETMQVSNDFQNLLGSINIPILMLERDLRIRRFTDTAAQLFNLIPTDVGRPLSDIKHNLNILDLEQLILEVINTLHIHNQEVQDQAGQWYDLRIRPYRTLDNRIDGAVVVLVDINVLKRSAQQLQAVRSYAEVIVQTIHESLVVLNPQLQVVMANQRFYETFQVLPTDADKMPVFDLGNINLSVSDQQKVQIFDLGCGQWNIPQLRSLLEELLLHNTPIENFPIEHDFAQIGKKMMLLNACKICPTPAEQLILLAIKDISDR